MSYGLKPTLCTSVLEDSDHIHNTHKIYQAIWVTTLGAFLYSLTLLIQFPQQPLPLFAFVAFLILAAGLCHSVICGIAQALARAQRRASEADLMNRILSIAVSGAGEPEALLTICTELSLFLNVPQAALATLDDMDNSITIVAERLARGRKSWLGLTLCASSDPFVQRLIDLKAPVAIADVRTHPITTALAQRMRSAFRKRGTVSMLMIPIRVQKQMLGVLALETFERREFTAQEIAFAQAAGRQAGFVLETTRMSDQRLAHVLDLEMRVAEYSDAVTEANRRLEELNRFDSQFVPGISHELYVSAAQPLQRVDVLEASGR